MSNQVFLTAMKFTPTAPTMKFRGETFGWVMADDYGSSFADCYDDPMPEADSDFFNQVCDEHSDEVTAGLVDWALEHGCHINDVFFSAEELMKMRGMEEDE